MGLTTGQPHGVTSTYLPLSMCSVRVGACGCWPGVQDQQDGEPLDSREVHGIFTCSLGTKHLLILSTDCFFHSSNYKGSVPRDLLQSGASNPLRSIDEIKSMKMDRHNIFISLKMEIGCNQRVCFRAAALPATARANFPRCPTSRFYSVEMRSHMDIAF